MARTDEELADLTGMSVEQVRLAREAFIAASPPEDLPVPVVAGREGQLGYVDFDRDIVVVSPNEGTDPGWVPPPVQDVLDAAPTPPGSRPAPRPPRPRARRRRAR